ncbi:MAG: FMN-binding protein, partial [Pseudomonadales bacterium]|nr:FMN-binding protein [Pseudomonadales bacterium]
PLWKVNRDGSQFDKLTGATMTPRAVVKAVHNALLYYQQHQTTLFLPSRT